MLYYVQLLLAVIGATAILGALTFVSAVIGGLVNAMIVLMSGPLIDGYLRGRGRSRESHRAGA